MAKRIGILVATVLATTGLGARPPQITRSDLAVAYQRFEQALLDRRPQGEALIEANLAFEDVTRDFFRMGFSSAVQKLNDKALELALQRPPSVQERWLASQRLTLEPMIVVTGERNPVAVLESMYAVDGAARVPIDIVASREGGTARWTATPTTEGDEAIRARVELTPPEGQWKGTWKLRLELPDGTAWETGRLLIAVPENLDGLRETLVHRLAGASANPELKRAVATCQARIELLKMNPNPGRSVEFLADYNVLAPEISAEVADIEAGRNPYAGRKGDYWRIVQVGGTRIPLRVYVPESLDLGEPAPLIIVLHGAGGDENMFFDAYGQGAIKAIAEERGLIVASPATFFFASTSKNLAPMIDDLSADYTIDRDRVYVLGHSMGGGAAAILSRDRTDILAAACCIAGARGLSQAKSLAPTLVVAAELDAIVPANAVENEAKAAIAAGLPIAFRKIRSYGHTLVVEAELARCVDWLLEHRRPGARSE